MTSGSEGYRQLPWASMAEMCGAGTLEKLPQSTEDSESPDWGQTCGKSFKKWNLFNLVYPDVLKVIWPWTIFIAEDFINNFWLYCQRYISGDVRQFWKEINDQQIQWERRRKLSSTEAWGLGKIRYWIKSGIVPKKDIWKRERTAR